MMGCVIVSASTTTDMLLAFSVISASDVYQAVCARSGWVFETESMPVWV